MEIDSGIEQWYKKAMKILMTRKLARLILLILCAIAAMSWSPASKVVIAQSDGATKPAIEFIPLAELRELVSPNHSNLDAYLLTDGAWVKDAPIFVNQEFDFGTALGLEGIGAGIASAQRQRVSKETAGLLEPLANIDLNKIFASSLRQLEKKAALFKHYRVAVYAILFGHPKARLQCIVELHRKVGKDGLAVKKNEPLRLIHVSKEFPIQGAGSWSENEARQTQKSINEGFSLLAQQIGNLFDLDGIGNHKMLLQPAEKQAQRCHLGGNQYGKGFLLQKRPSTMVLDAVPLTFMLCTMVKT